MNILNPIQAVVVAGLLGVVASPQAFAFNPQPEPPERGVKSAQVKANPQVKTFRPGQAWIKTARPRINTGSTKAFNPQPEPPEHKPSN